MKSTSKQYTIEDFKKEEHLFTYFYFSGSERGESGSTEYYYMKLANGGYRLVGIDSLSDKICCQKEFASATEFVDFMWDETRDNEQEPELEYTVIDLFPEETRNFPKIISKYFNQVTADLISTALSEKDNELVQALLPDFSDVLMDVDYVLRFGYETDCKC